MCIFSEYLHIYTDVLNWFYIKYKYSRSGIIFIVINDL